VKIVKTPTTATLSLVSALLLGAGITARAEAPRYAVQYVTLVADGSATMVNHGGELAGYFFDGEANAHDFGERPRPFLFSGGKVKTFRAMGKNWHPAGINDRGDVVGTYDFTVYLYADGQFSNLSAATHKRLTLAAGINNRGDVAGTATTGAFPEACVYSRGRLMPLGTAAGFTGSQAVGINPAGQIAGTLTTQTNGIVTAEHAFLYSDGGIQDLGTAGGFANSEAMAIGRNGEVTGAVFDLPNRAPQHAFVWQGGAMTDLGTLPGGTSSYATGIDSFGRVVGTSSTGSSPHGFVWTGGVMNDVNALIDPAYGVTIRRILAVNDAGVITATSGSIFDGGGNNGNLYLLWPRRTDIHAPKLTVEGGRRRVVHGGRVVLHGTTRGSACSVTYSSNRVTVGPFAKGVKPWNCSVPLKPGRNVVTLVAHGQGGDSRPLTVRVMRR
jgi:probable HAF family extracellular repeat protein